MKKFYKIVLMLIALSCVFAVAAYAESDESVTKFLTNFDFVKTGEVFEIDEYITRGEFAELASRLVPGNEVEGVFEQYFVDTPKTHEYFDGIMFLKNKGYVNGVSELMFAPDELIETDHALVMMYSIMGYGDYIDTVMSSGPNLMKGVKAEKNLSRKSAFRLMYNVLFSDAVSKNFSSGGEMFVQDNGGRYMEVQFNIFETEGILSENGVTSIYGKSTVREDEIVINDAKYINSSGENNYLGYRVKAYYIEDETESSVYYMEAEKNDVMIFDAEKRAGFADNTYSFWNENDKKKNYQLSADYKLIYNRKAISNENTLTQSQFDEIMNPTNGEVVLIDNNRDGKYDICKIMSYETIVVKGYSDETETLANFLPEPATIDFTGFDEVNIVDTNGAKRNFLSLKKYDVVSIAKDIDNSYAEIIISTDRVEGRVQKCGEDESIEVLIDDKTYTVLKELKDTFDRNILGKQAVLLLDHNGYVVYNANIAAMQGMYAYIIDVKQDYEDDITILEVYTEDNNYRKLELAEKVKIDDVRYKTAASQYNAISNATCGVGFVAIIKLNDENQVTEVDLPVKSGSAKDEEWQIAEGMENVDIAFSSGMLGTYKLAVKLDAVGFFIPSGGEKQRYYASLARSFSAAYDPRRIVTAYVKKKDAMYADVLTFRSEINGTYDMSLSDSTRYMNECIVSKMTVTLDEDDEVLTKIEVISGNAYHDILYQGANPVCRWTGKRLQVGDVIKYGTDIKTGTIPPDQLVIMYSPASDENGFEGLYYDSGVQSNGKGSLYNSVTSGEARLIYGWIYEKADEYIRLAYRKNPATETITGDDKYLFPLSSLNVVVYDSDEIERVKIGNHNDVNGYVDTFNGSKVVLRAYQGSWIYVIK